MLACGPGYKVVLQLAARFAELLADHTYVIVPGPPLIVPMVSSEPLLPLNLRAASNPARLLHECGILNQAREVQLLSPRAVFQAQPHHSA